jgi:hypothetical protein
MLSVQGGSNLIKNIKQTNTNIKDKKTKFIFIMFKIEKQK